jgi:hypothetical protein
MSTADTSPSSAPVARFARLGPVAALIGAITAARIIALFFGHLDLHPDEAQYWSWSRDPDWGYFSKPPMVGWIIAGAGALCGSAEACIRAPVALLHMATALAIFGIGRRLFDGRVGAVAALAFITLPGVTFSANVISTDPPLMTFWALALYALVRLRHGSARPLAWWAVLGCAFGLGLMSKYAMMFFAIGLALLLVFDSDFRRRLPAGPAGWGGLALALVLAAVIYAPNLLWNMAQGFVTFVHTGSNANLRGALFHPAELAAFLLSQFGVFGPLLFAALLWIVLRPRAWWADGRMRLLAAFVLPMLLSITVLALLSRANANWAAPVYIAASVWVAAVLVPLATRWLRWSFVINGAVAAVLLVMPVAASGPGVYAGLRLPGGTDPFASYYGWRQFGDAVAAQGARLPGVALMSDDRKLIAALLYYGRPPMGKVFAWHPGPRVDDHFKLTRPLPPGPGGDVLFISRYPEHAHIRDRFAAAREIATLKAPGSLGRGHPIRVIHLRGFLGYKAARP